MDTDVFKAYLKKQTPVNQEVGSRIRIINMYNDTVEANVTTDTNEGYKSQNQSFWFLVVFTILTMLS